MSIHWVAFDLLISAESTAIAAFRCLLVSFVFPCTNAVFSSTCILLIFVDLFWPAIRFRSYPCDLGRYKLVAVAVVDLSLLIIMLEVKKSSAAVESSFHVFLHIFSSPKLDSCLCIPHGCFFGWTSPPDNKVPLSGTEDQLIKAVTSRKVRDILIDSLIVTFTFFVSWKCCLSTYSRQWNTLA